MARLTPFEKLQKRERIRQAIAEGKRVSAICEDEGIGERQFWVYKREIAQLTEKEFKKNADSRVWEIYDDTRDSYEVALEELTRILRIEYSKIIERGFKKNEAGEIVKDKYGEPVKIYDYSKVNSNALLGVIKARAELAEKKKTLAQDVGLFPKSPMFNMQIANMVNVSPWKEIDDDIFRIANERRKPTTERVP